MLIIHLQSNLILSFKSRFIVYQSYHTCLCVYHMTRYCPRKYAAAGLSCLRLTDTGDLFRSQGKDAENVFIQHFGGIPSGKDIIHQIFQYPVFFC